MLNYGQNSVDFNYMFKYNVSYNTNIVNLNSSVWDKFCEYCAL